MKEQTNRNPILPLTDEQRRAALDKAMRVRAERMQLKRDLKQGLVTARQAFEMSDGGMEAASGMRVEQLIMALPDHGKAKAAAIMRKLDISPSRRLRGVGARQRLALLEHIEGADR